MPNGNGATLENRVEHPKCECGSELFIKDDKGEEVCSGCGLVAGNLILEEGQRGERTFDDNLTARVHDSFVNRSRPDHGLGSEVRGNRDSQGHHIKDAWRLSRAHNQTQIRANRRELVAYRLLKQYASQEGLPKDIFNEAILIYRNAANAGFVRGHSVNLVLAVAIYDACRMLNMPRTLDEVARLFGERRIELGRLEKTISIGLRYRDRLHPSSPIAYVGRFCSALNYKSQRVQSDVERKAREILALAVGAGLLSGGCSPIPPTAAAIYLSGVSFGADSEHYKPQSAVAEITGVTEASVRNWKSRLNKKLGLHIKVPYNQGKN